MSVWKIIHERVDGYRPGHTLVRIGKNDFLEVIKFRC